MIRKNLSGADNQQERSREYKRGYVTGLVDGEGSFHIAFQVRKDLPLGISIIPEFHVSQHQESLVTLKLVKDVLGCGYIKPNHSHSRDLTHVFVVRDRHDLVTKIIPFFKYNKFITSKRKDFKVFAQVVNLMQSDMHRSIDGIKKIVNLAYSMNRAGARRTRSKKELLYSLKSSETIWRTRLKKAKKK